MQPAKSAVQPLCARTQHFVKNHRGVKSWKEVSPWLEWRGIEDIECITPDQAGVARGKMMPSKKFTSNTSLALPSAVFMTTISGGYPENGNGFSYPEDDGDIDFPSPLADQLDWLRESGFVSVDAWWVRAGHALFGGFKP